MTREGDPDPLQKLMLLAVFVGVGRSRKRALKRSRPSADPLLSCVVRYSIAALAGLCSGFWAFVRIADASPSDTVERPSIPRSPTPSNDSPAPIPEGVCTLRCRRWVAEVRSHGSLNRLAFGASLEVNYVRPRFALALGLDASAWLDHTFLEINNGSINPYLGIYHRLPLDRVTLRQRLAVGLAILAGASPNHDAGSAGPYLEFSPLSFELYGPRKRVAFVLDGVSIAIAIPGHPVPLLAHTEYRLSLGLRI